MLPLQGTTAATLFNLSRVVGQTFGTAVIGSLITEREKYHSAVLVDAISQANSEIMERFDSFVAAFLGVHGDRALAQTQAWASISSTMSLQAYVLAFADAFVLVAVVLGMSALLVVLLPPLRERASPPIAPSPVGRPSLAPETRP